MGDELKNKKTLLVVDKSDGNKVNAVNFMKQDQLHQNSTRAIHNYFFIRGVEALREGWMANIIFKLVV